MVGDKIVEIFLENILELKVSADNVPYIGFSLIEAQLGNIR